MIETIDLRAELHAFIDTSDDKLIKLLYALAKEYNLEENYISEIITQEDIAVFEKRSSKRKTGETNIYTWEEAKEIILSSKNK